MRVVTLPQFEKALVLDSLHDDVKGARVLGHAVDDLHRLDLGLDQIHRDRSNRRDKAGNQAGREMQRDALLEDSRFRKRLLGLRVGCELYFLFFFPTNIRKRQKKNTKKTNKKT